MDSLFTLGHGLIWKFGPSTHLDSASAKSLISSTMGTKRSKHIDLRSHYTREVAAMGIITIHGIPSHKNAADGFTKVHVLNRDGVLALIQMTWKRQDISKGLVTSLAYELLGYMYIYYVGA
jgi:hypothetical protein